MLKISSLVLVVSCIFIHVHGSVSVYEHKNNKILLQVIDIIKKNKKNNVEIKHLEKHYLSNINKDILHQYDHLPHNLKSLLGDFKKSYRKFKKKVALIKPLMESEPKNTNLQNDDFLWTILGLKPVSICRIDKTYLKMCEIVNSHYPRELSWGNGIIDENHNEVGYVFCHDFVFPLPFIKACYPEIEDTPSFAQDLMNLRSVYDNNKIKNFIDSHWKLRTRDDVALMLGLVPTWFGNVSMTEEARGLLNPAFSHHFRVLIIPGVVHYKDESAYVKLYEKLLEYTWVELYGLENYLEGIEHQLIALNLPIKIRNNTTLAYYDIEAFDQLIEFNYLSKILSQIH